MSVDIETLKCGISDSPMSDSNTGDVWEAARSHQSPIGPSGAQVMWFCLHWSSDNCKKAYVTQLSDKITSREDCEEGEMTRIP